MMESIAAQAWESNENTPNFGGTCSATNIIDALKEIAGPPQASVKRAIETAAKRAGLTYWRAFDLWYGKARKVQPGEIDAVQQALEAKRRLAVRNELHELRIRIETLEARLAQGDPEFFRPHIDAMRRTRGAAGDMAAGLR
jgi:BMFP domain-containing protein YqiC